MDVTPTIVESASLCNRFLDGLAQKNSKPRMDIHVSDLVYCLRSAYFGKIAPKAPTETELGYFVDGANRHLALQGISGLKREYKVERYGVVGSIDLYGADDCPIEIKTTRSHSGVSQHYLKQLGFYCVLCGVDHGHLIIQRLLNKSNPWEWYVINYSQKELEDFLWELKDSVYRLKKALLVKNPFLLPKSAWVWKCRGCKYSIECGGVC